MNKHIGHSLVKIFSKFAQKRHMQFSSSVSCAPLRLGARSAAEVPSVVPRDEYAEARCCVSACEHVVLVLVPFHASPAVRERAVAQPLLCAWCKAAAQSS